MLVGVKFCGGCNPRYERGQALQAIKKHFEGRVDFVIAEEGKEYDLVFVIGGCSSCCASYDQYKSKNQYYLMWDEDHIKKSINTIEEMMGGNEFGLEKNL